MHHPHAHGTTAGATSHRLLSPASRSSIDRPVAIRGDPSQTCDRPYLGPLAPTVYRTTRTTRISTTEWQTTFISVGRLGEQIRRLFFTWLPLLDDGRLGIMSSPLVQRRMPKSTKNLRACLMCAILLTSDQFANEGCPNCESILRTTGESFLFPPCPTDATKS